MGKSCPKCSSGVEHDFGVFVCAKCGSVLFIDFDGNVQLSTPETAAGESSAPVPEVEAPSQFSSEALNEPLMDPMVDPILEPIADAYAEAALESEAPVVNQDFSQDLFQTEEAQVIALPIEEPQEPAAPSRQGPPPAITDVNFEDVVDYANQIELDNTPLVYTLWIEGIDHKEVREKVIEVLKDIKFNLHLKDIIPTIKGGVLELRDLNPVKTSLIATRLREESVKFRWKQSVYQSEAASGT